MCVPPRRHLARRPAVAQPRPTTPVTDARRGAHRRAQRKGRRRLEEGVSLRVPAPRCHTPPCLSGRRGRPPRGQTCCGRGGARAGARHAPKSESKMSNGEPPPKPPPPPPPSFSASSPYSSYSWRFSGSESTSKAEAISLNYGDAATKRERADRARERAGRETGLRRVSAGGRASHARARWARRWGLGAGGHRERGRTWKSPEAAAGHAPHCRRPRRAFSGSPPLSGWLRTAALL